MLSTAKCRVVFTSLFLLLTVAACGNGGTTQGPSAATSPNVTIEILDGMHPEAREIKIETIPQNNCGGTAEVENQVQKSISIERTIEVGAGFEVNGNGQIGFAGTDAELGVTVATHLGYSYGTVEDISRSITVKAKPGTNMEHCVSLQEIWEVGSAKIVVNGQETTVPFSFRRDFVIELLESKDIDHCESEVSAPSPVAKLTDTPTAAKATPSNGPTFTPTPCSGDLTPCLPQQGDGCPDNMNPMCGACELHGQGGTEVITMTSSSCLATKIRIDLRKRATGYGFSLFKVEAYGSDDPEMTNNLLIGGDCCASSVEGNNPIWGCDRAIDGSQSSRWSSDWYEPQWLVIVLPEPKVVKYVVLRWESAYATEYQVSVVGSNANCP